VIRESGVTEGMKRFTVESKKIEGEASERGRVNRKAAVRVNI